MIKTILYTLLIMMFFAVLFVVGIFGPQQGRKVVQRVLEFIQWKPSGKTDSVLLETENAIKQFNDAHQNLQMIRQMALDRSKESFQELQGVYTQAREQLKELLSQDKNLSIQERKEMVDQFSALHLKRAGLVEEIIQSQQTLINMNDQMDQQLRAMTQWLNQTSIQASNSPSTSDKLRLQQLDNLKTTLRSFNNEASQLDALRILFITKNKDTVARLVDSNNLLESRFRDVLAQVGSTSNANQQQLWGEYQTIESEQKELFSALNSNEDSISDNYSKMLSGVEVVSKAVEYRTDNQLERFRDSFQAMEDQRRDLLISMRERQKNFMNSQDTVRQMMENNKYRTEMMRDQARQIADQFTRMEEYRKSAASAVESMTQELKEQSQATAQLSKEVMERNQNRVNEFMRQMEIMQDKLDQFIQANQQTSSLASVAINRIISLKEKIDALKASIQESEDRMKSAHVRLEKNQEALSQSIKDSKVSYQEKLINLKQQSEDQQRIFSERLKDQMQYIKNKQMDQTQGQDNKYYHRGSQ